MPGRADRVATPAPDVRLVEAAPAQVDAVRALFRDYADWLQAEVCLQSFERELADLPGAYAHPRGRLLLAVEDGARPVGCVALRPVDGETCEMKRLYVRPEARGRGLGRRLVAAALKGAHEAGYRRIVLETLPRMAEARRLYESLGFRERRHEGAAAAEVIFCELSFREEIEAS